MSNIVLVSTCKSCGVEKIFPDEISGDCKACNECILSAVKEVLMSLIAAKKPSVELYNRLKNEPNNLERMKSVKKCISEYNRKHRLILEEERHLIDNNLDFFREALNI